MKKAVVMQQDIDFVGASLGRFISSLNEIPETVMKEVEQRNDYLHGAFRNWDIERYTPDTPYGQLCRREQPVERAYVVKRIGFMVKDMSSFQYK